MNIATIGHNSGIAVYDPFRAQLGELRELNEKTVFNYEDPKGNKDARSHIYKLRQTKAAVEKARKEEKAASLEYGRRVDEQAKQIASEIESMIEVHDKPLREIEQRETDRVDRHEANLAEIIEAGRATVERWLELPLEAMKDRLAEVEAESIGEDVWEEFALRAAQAKEETLGQMREAIAKREKHDAEQAELERLRKEAVEREQKERDEKIAREAEQKARREALEQAERDKREAAAQAQAERDAAEKRELELKLAAEQAERRAAEAQKQAEDRVAQEAAEKAEREAAETAKREADKKHRASVNNAAVAAFAKGGLSEDAAKQAVTLIAQKAIPAVHISY